MSYEIYKVIHILCIIIVASGIGAQFLSDKSPKFIKILSGIASLLIMVSGMGLIARIGLPHGAPWPIWIKVKLVLWLVIAALGPIMAKRLVEKKKYGYFVMIALFLITIVVAITKLA